MKYLAVFILLVINSYLQAQWIPTKGPVGGAIYCLGVSGNNLFAGTYGTSVFLTTDNGTNWGQLNNGLTDTVVRSLAISGTNIFAGTASKGLFISGNNGTNWSHLSNGPSSDYPVYSLAVNGTNIIAGTWGNGTYLSTDNGSMWIQKNNGLTEKYISALAFSGDEIFAGTGNSGIFYSTDSGSNWTKANTSLPEVRITAFTVSGINIFASTEGAGIFRSTDSGANWISVNNGLTNYMVEALAISGTKIFAGINGGVCLTTDNGANWTPVNNGLYDNIYIGSFAVSGSYIFLGTDTTGVWKRLLSDIVGVSTDAAQIPKEFTLSQNYPNPWNPTTNIKYSIPKASIVSIKVYDITGKEIGTLVNEEKQAGTYELTWKAGNLPSGVYIYRLQAGEFIGTKKMILLK